MSAKLHSHTWLQVRTVLEFYEVIIDNQKGKNLKTDLKNVLMIK